MKGKRYFLIGIILSGIVGWALGYLRLPYLEKDISFLMGFISCLAILSLCLVLIVLWKKNSQLFNFFNNNSGEQSSNNATKSYIIIWISIAVIIVLGTLINSYLIYKQNQFSKTQIENQNQKITQQSELIESTRKSNLIILISNIFDKIDEEIKSNPSRKLSDDAIERIVALNYSFEPYSFFKGDSLSEKKLSPERGLLLLMLSKTKMDSSSFDKIKDKVSFSSADLENVDLNGVDLEDIDLSNANLKNANLLGANLRHANLNDANLWGANLNEIDLEKANLNKADLRWVEMNDANLKEANLNGAKLTNAKLRNTDMRSSKMEWSDLTGALLNESKLDSANLAGADFGGANLTGVNLSHANLKKANLSETNLNQVNLSGTNLFNVSTHEEKWFEKLKEWQIIGAKEIHEKYKIVDDITKKYKHRLQNKE